MLKGQHKQRHIGEWAQNVQFLGHAMCKEEKQEVGHYSFAIDPFFLKVKYIVFSRNIKYMYYIAYIIKLRKY